MIETKAHAYNQAVQDIKKYQTVVSLQTLKEAIETDPEKLKGPGVGLDPWAVHCPELDMSFTYNAQVTDDAMSRRKIEDTERARKIIDTVVYTTRSFSRAKKTVELYEKMTADGYIPVQDTTADMHLKKAQLVGQSDGIMGSTNYDEKVKVIHTDDHQGYQKARQRTRFYQPAFDSRLFLKVL